MSSANARWRDSANCWNCTTITLAPTPSVQHWVRKPISWSASRTNRSTFSRLWCLETHRVVAPGYSFLQDLLANCIIYYNACILSELLERAERRQDYQRADAIKRANLASWKHVNLYGAYSFLDIGDGIDLQKLVNLLEAARGRGAAVPTEVAIFDTN